MLAVVSGGNKNHYIISRDFDGTYSRVVNAWRAILILLTPLRELEADCEVEVHQLP